MKKIVIAALLLCLKLNVYSQTAAVDFNINDCSGTPHHLFSELDSGKVVVLCFVMPCFGCIAPTRTARNVTASFAAAYPNRINTYLVDDEADNTCSSLASWRNANGFGLIPVFVDSALMQGQYGLPAMPKIVVLGGGGHYVYDIQDSRCDSMQITKAINDALAGVVPEPIPNSVRQTVNIAHVSLSPNPAKDRLSLSCHLVSAGDVRMDIFDAAGHYVKTVIKESQPAGHHVFTVETDGLSNGNYILKLQSGDGRRALKFTVSK